MTHIWYFAYGSNLDPKQMESRVGPFQEALKARLPRFRLIFRGYSKMWNGATADIEPCGKKIVYGVVYKISKQQLRKLDKFEGFPNVYKRTWVKVIVENKEILSAVTYIRVNKEPRAPPSKQYLETIIRGLKAHGYSDDVFRGLG